MLAWIMKRLNQSWQYTVRYCAVLWIKLRLSTWVLGQAWEAGGWILPLSPLMSFHSWVARWSSRVAQDHNQGLLSLSITPGTVQYVPYRKNQDALHSRISIGHSSVNAQQNQGTVNQARSQPNPARKLGGCRILCRAKEQPLSPVMYSTVAGGARGAEHRDHP